MKTHLASYRDALSVVRYLRKNHASTGWDWVSFDEKRVRNVVVDMIRSRQADIVVATEEGNIRGVILLQEDLFFWNGKARYATDVHHIATGGGAACMKRAIAWAKDHECECFITAVATDTPRAESFYERLGFERQGGTLVHRLGSVQEEAA